MVGPTQGAEGFGRGRGGGTYRRRLERDLGMVMGPFHRDIHSDDVLHRRRRDRSVRGGRAAMRLLPTPSLARPGMTLIVLALVLAACGGGGEAAAVPPPRPVRRSAPRRWWTGPRRDSSPTLPPTRAGSWWSTSGRAGAAPARPRCRPSSR